MSFGNESGYEEKRKKDEGKSEVMEERSKGGEAGRTKAVEAMVMKRDIRENSKTCGSKVRPSRYSNWIELVHGDIC